MFTNVLIVCHANICRSPTAEALFRALHPACQPVAAGFGAEEEPAAPVAFRSAGLHALDGHGMDPVMQRLLRERGIAVEDHRARRLNGALVEASDLVLVTERRQLREVEALAPTSRGKVYLLGQWEGADVADPHGRSEAAYRASFAQIENLVKGWITKIC